MEKETQVQPLEAGELHITVNQVSKIEGETFKLTATLKNKSLFKGTTQQAAQNFFFQMRFGFRSYGLWTTRAVQNYDPITLGPAETKQIDFVCPVADVRVSGGFTFQLIYWVEGQSADRPLGWFEGQASAIQAVLATDIAPDLAFISGKLD